MIDMSDTSFRGSEDQRKDSDSERIKPDFDFSKSNIDAGSIKSETDKYVSNSKEVELESKNSFPIDAFPLAVQEIIIATNASLNYPPDFIGASILYAASIAIGNTRKVEVRNGWHENAVLFIANVGKPNTNKSHPLSFALEPIFERDKISYKEFQMKRLEYEQSEDKRNIRKPVWLKYLITDFTPEALIEIHKFNYRGIGVNADELAVWFKNFNRYRKGADQEFWLSAWSGKQINNDRKGSEPVFIPLPYISICGNIQTRILLDLAKDSRAQNGFIDRILFAFPDGIKKPYWSEIEIDPSIRLNWRKIIHELLSINLEFDEATFSPVPKVLKFTPEAYQTLKDWERGNTDLCNTTDSDALASIYGKFDIHVIRLSLILEMLQFACNKNDNQTVGIESITGAIKLTTYFRRTAEKVHAIIINSNPLDKHPSNKQNLYNALPDYFRTEVGLQIAAAFNMADRTFKRFINDKELFTRVRQGEYEKRF